MFSIEQSLQATAKNLPSHLVISLLDWWGLENPIAGL